MLSFRSALLAGGAGGGGGSPGLSLIGSTSGSYTAVTGQSLDISGIGIAAGDIVIVVGGRSSNGGSTGNLLCSGDQSGAYSALADLFANDTRDCSMAVYYKRMGGTPDSTLTVTGPGSTAYPVGWIVYVWRGADATTPIDVNGTGVTTINSHYGNPPAVTPVTTGAIVIACGAGVQPAGGGSPFTIPSGMENGVSINITGSSKDCGIWIASAEWVSGAYDPPAWTGGSTSSTEDAACAHTFALRPA